MITAQSLEKKLREASAAYYNDGQPNISDNEFDNLRDQLEDLDPKNSFLAEIGASAESNLTKVSHDILMGSLKKIKTIKEYETWLKTVSKTTPNKKMAISWKLDGISIELLYKKGKFVQAITRGDGEVGEDVTHTISKAQGVPKTLSTNIDVSVRSEALLPIAVWKEKFSDKANPRNAVSGMVRRSDTAGAEHICCMGFDVQSNALTIINEFDKINWLARNDFQPVHTLVLEAHEVPGIVTIWETQLREKQKFEVDGVVVKISSIEDQEKLGEHNQRPYWARAWKFAPMGGHTTLEDVVWTIGTHGLITPVSRVAPVAVGGTINTKPTLHNIANIERLGVMIGDVVEVIRAGDCIPQIVRVVSQGKNRTPIPTPSCPACGANVKRVGPKLFCGNDGCTGVAFKVLKKWVEKRNIMHLGKANLQKLVLDGVVKTIPDLYKIDAKQIADAGVGDKMSTKILAEIDKSRSVTLADMIGSLSIDVLGRREAKKLVDNGIDNLSKWLNITAVQIESFPGYQETKAGRIVNGIAYSQELIKEVAGLLCIVYGEEPKGDNSVENQFSICLTGTMSKPRKDIAADVEAAGHVVVNSVNKETTHLCQADPSSSSKKTEKADKLGIPIISESQLVDMLQ